MGCLYIVDKWLVKEIYKPLFSFFKIAYREKKEKGV